MKSHIIPFGAAVAAFGAMSAFSNPLEPLAGSQSAGSHTGLEPGGPFRRVASFPVYLNTDENAETVAEIVAATPDGNTLIYTDSEFEVCGFVDITNAGDPQPDGVTAVGGEPTAVAVRGGFALVGVNTSASFVNTSGDLVVISTTTRQVVRRIPLGGQPDSVAVSPDGQYAVVVIENERDEGLGNGEPPQAPAGYLVIVDLIGNNPADWTTRNVDLTGVCDLFPDDPEPEFVDISVFNIAAVTLQENNHIALVSLASGSVVIDFPAGTVDLVDVDIEEEDVISQIGTLTGVPREPDAIAWISPFSFVTADEGDLFGGSRGFTTWQPFGGTLFEAGNSIEHLAARVGHYPESRSENKGTEPEGVEFGAFGDERFLFVGAERANMVLVYRVGSGTGGVNQPELAQVLPTGVGPEGLLAIPSRDLFVVACEVDARDDAIRSTLMIYERTNDGDYPAIASANRATASIPIPWGALSGLAVDPASDDTLFAVPDSFYKRSRVLEIDRSRTPATIVREWPIVDSGQVLGNALRRVKFTLPNTPDFVIADIVNGDGTVNLDLEGIATIPGSLDLWVVSEGTGNLNGGVSDPGNRPFERPNLLLQLSPDATSQEFVIARVVGIPFALASQQLRFGLEGVAAAPDGTVYVAFQREWGAAGDPSGSVRIGRFLPSTGMWSFAYYPLDAPTSPNGGWVGLSEIVSVDAATLAILERDNQGGPDARIKRVYSVDLTGATFSDVSAGPPSTLTKTLEFDLLAADSFAPFAGLTPEKLEGMARLSNGDVLIVNDNDGVDDNSGETRIVTLPGLLN